MRNKHSKILVALFLCLLMPLSIKAADTSTTTTTTVDGKTDIKCVNDKNGTIKVKWNEERKQAGVVYTCVYKYNYETENISLGTANTQEEAEELCKNQPEIDAWHAPSCCNSDDPKFKCSGSHCTKPQCIVKKNCKPAESTTKPNLPPIVKPGKPDKPGTPSITRPGIVEFPMTAMINLLSEINSFEVKNKLLQAIDIDGSSIGGGGGSAAEEDCTYEAIMPKTKATRASEDCVLTPQEVYAYSYEVEVTADEYSHDPVYCLQPGASGPGASGLDYVLDTNFDVSVCANQFKNNKGENLVQCGLADILFQTVEPSEDSAPYTITVDGEEITATANWYKSNGKYSNEAITLALRLWMAQYGKNQYSLKMDGSSSESILDWIPKENFYEYTAKAIANGKTYDTSYKANMTNNRNLLYCGKDETHGNCVIDQAIELFHHTESATKDTFLGGATFEKEVPVVKYTQTSTYMGETDVQLPEKIGDVIQECTEEDIINGTCDVEVKYYVRDPNTGKLVDVTDKVILPGGGRGSYCDKRNCKIVTTTQKLCEEWKIPGNKQEFIIKVNIKKWQRNNGWVRFYTHATQPSKYQKMISFAYNLEKCETENSTTTPGEIEYTTEIVCPCNDTVRCNDLSTKENLQKSCNTSSDYTKSTISGPNMNCILNACQPLQQEQYKYNRKYNVNDKVCNLFCKDDVELYMSGKTSTYAGMQFRYDLASVLNSHGILSNTLVGDSQKLTSLVKVTRQCSSEIKYDYWEEEYNKMKDMLELAAKSGNENTINAAKKEISQWLYELQNCNLYTASEIVDPYNSNVVPRQGTSKDYALKNALCGNNDECPTLSIKYDDSEYGTAKISSNSSLVANSSLNRTYYCKNTAGNKCYEYKKGEAVEISGSNNRKTIQYLDCSTNGSCSTKTMQIPQNDYATFKILSESDFYQDAKYRADVYTGKVKESSNEDRESAELPSNSYPVSTNTPTGTYNINYTFKKVPSMRSTKYDYSCVYDVYNTTVLYDCDYDSSSGTIDLTNCKNSCFEMNDGIPVLKESCSAWKTSTSKSYGFVFRNVELDNLFPDSDVTHNDISTRDSGTNWVGRKSVIDSIESSAKDIFTNDKYLDYRYVLTPSAIKLIKEYNDKEASNGGYLNQTLEKCEIIKNEETGLFEFRNCKSVFLSELKRGDYNRAGVEVSGNKAGA